MLRESCKDRSALRFAQAKVLGWRFQMESRLGASEIDGLQQWLHWRMRYAQESLWMMLYNRPDLFARLVHNLERAGVCMDSDYSGTRAGNHKK
jgi:hypothetical protein